MSAEREEDAARVLEALVEAEHAALYGYGVLGARLDDPTRSAARAATTAHRSARDRVAAALRDLGAEPPAAEVAYDVSVGGQQDALALAVRLEAGLGVLFRDLVGSTDEPSLRQLGLDGLIGTAVRAASWRELLGQRPPTVALPGTA